VRKTGSQNNQPLMSGGLLEGIYSKKALCATSLPTCPFESKESKDKSVNNSSLKQGRGRV